MSETFPELIMNAALSAGCKRVLACIDTPLIALDFQMVWASTLPSTDDRQSILNAVDSMLNDVLVLRRTWVAARSSDLYLMMAAPLGSVDQPAWKALAAEIERDDRLARKHVWLPDKDGGNFLPFIETTFLARPWSAADGRVDALKLLTEQIAMPTGWQQLLLDDELQGTELVRKLMDLETALA
jgi:hypothetical protein